MALFDTEKKRLSAKVTLRKIKKARESLLAGRLVKMAWYADALNSESFKQWHRTQIHRRITFDFGMVKKSKYNRGYGVDTELRRDCENLQNWLNNRRVFNGFCTGYMQKRYPEIDRQMRTRDF